MLNVLAKVYEIMQMSAEFSQEIDVNRNVAVEVKFKNYIEKVIMLNIKYRLNLR